MNTLRYIHESAKLCQSDDAICSSLVAMFHPVDCHQAHNVREDDVLLGRDKRSHNHVGNKRFRELIHAFRQEYQDTRYRREKSRITQQIIDIIVSIRGGRFLKYDQKQNEWCAVGASEQYEKVSHALRSAREPTSRVLSTKEKPTRQIAIPAKPENARTSFKKLMQEYQGLVQLLDDRDVKFEPSQQYEPEMCDWENFNGWTEDGFDDESIEILCDLFKV